MGRCARELENQPFFTQGGKENDVDIMKSALKIQTRLTKQPTYLSAAVAAAHQTRARATGEQLIISNFLD